MSQHFHEVTLFENHGQLKRYKRHIVNVSITPVINLQFNLQCTHDDTRSYRNVCNMSFVPFTFAAIFIIRLFSTCAFRVLFENLNTFFEKLKEVFDLRDVRWKQKRWFINTNSWTRDLQKVLLDRKCLTKNAEICWNVLQTQKLFIGIQKFRTLTCQIFFRF